jgi:hypothetical protein
MLAILPVAQVFGLAAAGFLVLATPTAAQHGETPAADHAAPVDDHGAATDAHAAGEADAMVETHTEAAPAEAENPVLPPDGEAVEGEEAIPEREHRMPIVIDPLTGVAMGGYDPVSYFTEVDPQQGRAEFEYYWHDVPWHFATAANRDIFAGNPEIYSPMFGGLGAMSLARGYPSEGNPRIYLVLANRLFLFYSTGNREAFVAAPRSSFERAMANWEKFLQDQPVIGGSGGDGVIGLPPPGLSDPIVMPEKPEEPVETIQPADAQGGEAAPADGHGGEAAPAESGHGAPAPSSGHGAPASSGH